MHTIDTYHRCCSSTKTTGGRLQKEARKYQVYTKMYTYVQHKVFASILDPFQSFGWGKEVLTLPDGFWPHLQFCLIFSKSFMICWPWLRLLQELNLLFLILMHWQKSTTFSCVVMLVPPPCYYHELKPSVEPLSLILCFFQAACWWSCRSLQHCRGLQSSQQQYFGLCIVKRLTM